MADVSTGTLHTVVRRGPAQALRSPQPASWPRTLYLGGWVLLAVMIFHVVALGVTGGAVTGPVSLRKPADFAEAGWLTCWAVAMVLPYLSLGPVRRAVVGGSVLAFGFIETTVMAIQAWRGVPSHYNFTTTFDKVLMRVGAAGTAGVFLIAMVVLLIASLRARPTEVVPSSLLLGIRCGVLTMLIGCLIGFTMISNMSGIWTGSFGSAFGKPQVGYMGPSASAVGREYLLIRPHTSGGDLVLLHAIGIHGLVLITIPAALLASTVVAEVTRRRIVGAISLAVLGAMTVIASQSFRSHPLASMGWIRFTLLAAAGLVLLASYAGVGRALLEQFRKQQAP